MHSVEMQIRADVRIHGVDKYWRW